MFLLEEIDTVRVYRAHDEQAGALIETWRAVVGGSGLVRRHKASIAERLLVGVGNRAAVLVDALCPIHRGKRSGQQTLSVRPIENEKVTVARGLKQQFARG